MNATATDIKPLAVDLETAARMCSVSARTLTRAVTKGKLRRCRQTARVTFLVEDLLEYLRTSTEENPKQTEEFVKGRQQKKRAPTLDSRGQRRTRKTR